jgi:SOS-response transcriptional repressor LexA
MGDTPRAPSGTSGFPSPAEDHMEETLDLQQLLVKRPSATYYVEIDGSAMRSLQIFDDVRGPVLGGHLLGLANQPTPQTAHGTVRIGPGPAGNTRSDGVASRA